MSCRSSTGIRTDRRSRHWSRPAYVASALGSWWRRGLLQNLPLNQTNAKQESTINHDHHPKKQRQARIRKESASAGSVNKKKTSYNYNENGRVKSEVHVPVVLVVVVHAVRQQRVRVQRREQELRVVPEPGAGRRVHARQHHHRVADVRPRLRNRIFSDRHVLIIRSRSGSSSSATQLGRDRAQRRLVAKCPTSSLRQVDLHADFPRVGARRRQLLEAPGLGQVCGKVGHGGHGGLAPGPRALRRQRALAQVVDENQRLVQRQMHALGDLGQREPVGGSHVRHTGLGAFGGNVVAEQARAVVARTATGGALVVLPVGPPGVLVVLIAAHHRRQVRRRLERQTGSGHRGSRQRVRVHGPAVVFLFVVRVKIFVGDCQRLPVLARLQVINHVEPVVLVVTWRDPEMALLAHVLAQHGRRLERALAVQALQACQLLR